MLNREEVKDYYSKCQNFSQTARHFGINNNYAYQIVTGYKTLVKSKITISLRKQPCFKCHGKTEHIHHIDKNSHNNDLTNLMPLCRGCHVKIHGGGLRRESLRWVKPDNCEGCGLLFNKDNYYRLGYCVGCWNKILEEVNNPIVY